MNKSCQEGLHYCPNCDRSFDVQGLHARVKELEGQNEQLQVQLAGCAVAALGGTKEPATKGMFGWSPAYQDVLDLRQRADRLQAEVEELEEDLVGTREALQFEQRVTEPLRERADRLQADRDSWQKQAEIQAGSLRTAQEEVERLKAISLCRCGDSFTLEDPGTCGNCLATYYTNDDVYL